MAKYRLARSEDGTFVVTARIGAKGTRTAVFSERNVEKENLRAAMEAVHEGVETHRKTGGWKQLPSEYVTEGKK